MKLSNTKVVLIFDPSTCRDSVLGAQAAGFLSKGYAFITVDCFTTTAELEDDDEVCDWLGFLCFVFFVFGFF